METKNKSFKNELKYIKKILDDPGGTIPGLFFESIDSVFRKISNPLMRKTTKQESPLPWWVNVTVVALASQVPTLIVSIFLGETRRWKEYNLGFLWMGYILLGLSAILIARVGVGYLFGNINKYVVDKIQRMEDLRDLKKILSYVWLRESSIKYVIYFTVVFTAFWSVSFSAIYANYLGVEFFEFGYGLFIGTIVFGVLTAPALYMEAWFFIFILHVGNYKYRLNDTAPVHSDVVQRFSRTTTILLYSFAIFIAFSTFAVSFDPVSGEFNVGAVLLVAVIGWIPTTIYFVGSQVSINRIVTSAKWDILNRVQDEIRRLNSGDIVNKENLEAINRLMDYHSKILQTPNSTLGVGTGLNFVNQLALPFIGLILANIDKLIDFFR